MPTAFDDGHAPALDPTGSESYDIDTKLGGSKGIRAEQPRGPFVLVFNPDSWIQVGRDVLPLLGEHPLVPGVNNVRANYDRASGRTTWDLDLFDVSLAKKGARRIPTSACQAGDAPDGQPGYVRRKQMEGGWWYHTPWESTGSVGVRAVHRTDTAAYWAWVRKLIDRGVVPAPDASVIARMADQAQSIADAASARHDDGSKRLRDQYSAAADHLRAQLAGAGSEVDHAVP